MAIYAKSNFGEIDGKVAEAVGSHWRGKKILRSLPKPGKKDPTLHQQIVRHKLLLAVNQLSPIKGILNEGFRDKTLKGLTGYNAALSVFLKSDVIEGEFPDLKINYSKMLLSRNSGSLLHLHRVKLSYQDDGNFMLSWTPKRNKTGASGDDAIRLIIFNETQGTYSIEDNAIRSDAQLMFDADMEAGDTAHVWVFCVRLDGNSVSKTEYLGTISLPSPAEADFKQEAATAKLSRTPKENE